ncbi:MAG: N-acetylmuramoyl-L-alanine amidase family protein [Saccharofermentanales bacterium]|nr:N-acetylmuramoyl-L-alanine amidase [Bacillota bacterium]NLB08575.1 N-acetylmuramoyl-L-alanine amidase [Clostridiales bacterium]
MKQKKAAQIILWLLLVSAVLLILSHFDVLDRPLTLPPDPEKLILAGQQESASEVSIPADSEPSTGAEVDADHIPEPTAIEQVDSTVDKTLQKLVFSDNDPDLLTTDGSKLRIWPEKSSVPQVSSSETAVLARATEDKPLAGTFIILDPGHGGSDLGVSWQDEDGSEVLLEKTLNLEIAIKVQEALTRLGAEVKMTRSTDEKHSYFYVMAYTADLLLQRYAADIRQVGYDPEPLEPLRLLMQDIIRINSGLQDSGGRGIFGSIGTPPNLKLIYDIQGEYKDTVFISLHLEVSEQEEDKGVRVRYMSKEYVHDMNNSYAAGTDALDHAPNYSGYNSARRESLATLLESRLTTLDPRLKSNLKAVFEDDLVVLRLNNVTSAQLTCGFLSNADDRARLTSQEGQSLIARGIAEALLQYFTANP